MVGSGIFISPKGVLKNSGNVGVSLIVWFACGILSMFDIVLILNSWSVSWSARLQNVLSVIKLLAFALIIVPGMMLLAQGHTENFQDAFSSQLLTLDKMPLAFYAGMFAYSGWFQTSFVQEELVRPERNNPLAVIMSVVTVIVGYMLTNVSYYTVLTAEDVLASQAVAVFPLVTAMVCIGDIYHLLNFFSFSRWLFIGLATLGLIIHRYRHPELPRPFKVPLFIPVCFTIVCLFAVGMSFYSDPVYVSTGCAMVLSGFPVYFLVISRPIPDCCRTTFHLEERQGEEECLFHNPNIIHMDRYGKQVQLSDGRMEYSWYWLDGSGQWIEYGKQHSNHCAATVTSADLEAAFLADRKGTVLFQAGSQQYEINFQGSYFARDASYSHQYCQTGSSSKTMIVARVLVGDFVQGSNNYLRPPPRPNNPNSFYGSCVDNPVNPSIFVIFEKHQIYPAYIIEYAEGYSCVIL
ncbi:Cystine/glutamate transporter [Chelonia mydas]|uniref:Poly [ADP-ribose] polymerase n=1 Tax=Chelonia mydas TaxID=8469 RepID=M7AGG5_CHEMY|nr:Cystine/glutamate transporter [Chelonia mydas]